MWCCPCLPILLTPCLMSSSNSGSNPIARRLDFLKVHRRLATEPIYLQHTATGCRYPFPLPRPHDFSLCRSSSIIWCCPLEDKRILKMWQGGNISLRFRACQVYNIYIFWKKAYNIYISPKGLTIAIILIHDRVAFLSWTCLHAGTLQQLKHCLIEPGKDDLETVGVVKLLYQVMSLMNFLMNLHRHRHIDLFFSTLLVDRVMAG